MRVKVIEDNAIRELTYRPWNGVIYGADKSEDIVKQYTQVPFDRSIGAFVMARGSYRFWERYFAELSEDEKEIRAAYLTYHPADVEDYLRRELDLAGDDPRLHHKARQTALQSLAEAFPARAKRLRDREVVTNTNINMRLNHAKDADLMQYLAKLERGGETRTGAVKRLLRLGIQYDQVIDGEREEALIKAREQGWI